MAPTVAVTIAKVGCPGIRAKMVVLLGIRGMVTVARMRTRQIQMLVPMMKTKNDTTGLSTRSERANASSQETGFGEKERTDREAICGAKLRSLLVVLN